MQRAQGPPSKQAFLPWMTWGLGAALQTPSSQGSAAPGLRVVPCPAGMLLDRVLPHPLSSQEETLQQVQRPLQVLGKGLSPPSPRTSSPQHPPRQLGSSVSRFTCYKLPSSREMSPAQVAAAGAVLPQGQPAWELSLSLNFLSLHPWRPQPSWPGMGFGVPAPSATSTGSGAPEAPDKPTRPNQDCKDPELQLPLAPQSQLARTC